MTVQTDNPYTWRLTTSGGIPYKFLGMSGSFDPEEGEIQWSALILATHLSAVLTELFPPALIIGSVVIPRGGFMPGLPSMVANNISFESQDGEKPIDPFSFDSSAVFGTYHGSIKIIVTFGPSGTSGGSDPQDPRTFLEITSKAGGDFIFSPAEGGKLEEEKNDTGEVDPETGEVDEDDVEPAEGSGDSKKVVRTPNLPSTILVPTTEWNITWKQIPFDHFKNVVIHRLRKLNGKVNSLRIPWLYNATPETLLFAGFDYSEKYTWRDDKVATPPIDVTFKLLEKRVLWKNTIVGHNHVWEPGKGWRRPYIGADSTDAPYEDTDMNFLFKA